MNEIKNHIDQIKYLCNLHMVKSLFAFGSVVSNQMNAESDIDLIVDIDISDPIEYADNYFDFKFQLEKLIDRKIDLLEAKSIKNQFLKQKIDKSKVLIYGR